MSVQAVPVRDDATGQFGVGLAFSLLAALFGAILWLIVAEVFQVRLAFIALGVSVGIGLILMRYAPGDRRNAPAAVVLTDVPHFSVSVWPPTSGGY